MQVSINPSSITNAVSLLAALSVATERLVEIIKGAIPALNNQASNSTKEGFRQVALHLLAAIAGFLSAWMAGATMPGVLPGSWNGVGGYIIIGLLVSGGSGFWNSILSYLKATKDLQEAQAAQSTPAPTIVS
jgi:drug/metabolite transporter (DMT)-like permease